MNLPSLKSLALGRRASVLEGPLVTFKPLLETGGLPMLAEPSTDGVDLMAWAKSHRESLSAQLQKAGGVLFRGFKPFSPEELAAFITAAAGDPLPYRERSSPRTQMGNHIYTSTDYPADQSIFLHNENSYQYTWPMRLFFLCVTPPATGGETPIADSRAILKRIPATVRERFQQQGIRYVRHYSKKLGLDWPTVFQTEDRSDVEAYCQARGLTCEWLPEGGLRTVCHRDAIVNHPHTGEATWFNHGVFFHISTLPGDVREALLTGWGETGLPNQTYYGDGTPIEEETLAILRDAFAQETVAFPWQRGDVLVLDNMLAAHGRHPFTGERKIVVGMACPMDRQMLEEGV